ncbi:MAG: hypothetical protein AAF434_17210 [Pseudomonadota bacterium]
MAITNFGELKTEIANFIDNDQITSVIPTFITLATTRINSELRIRDMEKRSVNTLIGQYIDLPDDFIELRNIQINSTPRRSLSYRTPEQIDFNVAESTGIPEYYSLYENVIEVYPEPASDYEIEIIYLASLADFVDDTDANSILTKYPGLYLWAALLEAESYIAEDARTATWAQRYADLITKLNNTADEGRYSGSRLNSATGVYAP